jgi:hypothetical protein
MWPNCWIETWTDQGYNIYTRKWTNCCGSPVGTFGAILQQAEGIWQSADAVSQNYPPNKPNDAYGRFTCFEYYKGTSNTKYAEWNYICPANLTVAQCKSAWVFSAD